MYSLADITTQYREMQKSDPMASREFDYAGPGRIARVVLRAVLGGKFVMMKFHHISTDNFSLELREG